MDDGLYASIIVYRKGHNNANDVCGQNRSDDILYELYQAEKAEEVLLSSREYINVKNKV
jgi:hypothetical protein